MHCDSKLERLFLSMDSEEGYPLQSLIEANNVPEAQRAEVRIMREKFSPRNINLAAKAEDVFIWCCQGNFVIFFSHVLTVLENAKQEDDNWRLALHAWLDSELKACDQFKFDF